MVDWLLVIGYINQTAPEISGAVFVFLVFLNMDYTEVDGLVPDHSIKLVNLREMNGMSGPFAGQLVIDNIFISSNVLVDNLVYNEHEHRLYFIRLLPYRNSKLAYYDFSSSTLSTSKRFTNALFLKQYKLESKELLYSQTAYDNNKYEVLKISNDAFYTYHPNTSNVTQEQDFNVLLYQLKLSGNKYFNLKSIRNFILHIDKLPDEYLKDNVRLDIWTYLVSLDNLDTDFDKKENFFKNLMPIANVFISNLQFKPLLSVDILIFLVVLLNPIMYLLSATLPFYVVLNTILVIIFIRDFILQKKGKVFGFGY